MYDAAGKKDGDVAGPHEPAASDGTAPHTRASTSKNRAVAGGVRLRTLLGGDIGNTATRLTPVRRFYKSSGIQHGTAGRCTKLWLCAHRKDLGGKRGKRGL